MQASTKFDGPRQTDAPVPDNAKGTRGARERPSMPPRVVRAIFWSDAGAGHVFHGLSHCR
jgi:hypothetical protein